MTLEELQKLKDIKECKLPRITGDDVNFLWRLDWYDGELTGILEYNNQKCYFHLADHFEEDRNYYRMYALVPLSETEYADELKWHELFRKHVGWHTDYLKGCYGKTMPQSEWHHYYDAANAKKEKLGSDDVGNGYLQHEVIALMEM